ncbi:uncharacterized protein [Rutidosis leptorrhynchoides]|uniref:uncharacterized protein n=1 Tax=Rutidosis leptorrhynchoides TaxID=125765 RepID=UPI003A9954DC
MHEKVRSDFCSREKHFANEASCNNRVTSFLFFNFPDEWVSDDLWKLLERYGLVRDVYLAWKHLSSGQRFGFVRFVGIRDIDCFAKTLNWTLIREDGNSSTGKPSVVPEVSSSFNCPVDSKGSDWDKSVDFKSDMHKTFEVSGEKLDCLARDEDQQLVKEDCLEDEKSSLGIEKLFEDNNDVEEVAPIFKEKESAHASDSIRMENKSNLNSYDGPVSINGTVSGEGLNFCGGPVNSKIEPNDNVMSKKNNVEYNSECSTHSSDVPPKSFLDHSPTQVSSVRGLASNASRTNESSDFFVDRLRSRIRQNRMGNLKTNHHFFNYIKQKNLMKRKRHRDERKWYEWCTFIDWFVGWEDVDGDRDGDNDGEHDNHSSSYSES